MKNLQNGFFGFELLPLQEIHPTEFALSLFIKQAKPLIEKGIEFCIHSPINPSIRDTVYKPLIERFFKKSTKYPYYELNTGKKRVKQLLGK